MLNPLPDAILQRIEAEYREMPGLKLTDAQAARLWHLNRDLCQAMLSVLVRDGILAQTRTGEYVSARR